MVYSFIRKHVIYDWYPDLGISIHNVDRIDLYIGESVCGHFMEYKGSAFAWFKDGPRFTKKASPWYHSQYRFVMAAPDGVILAKTTPANIFLERKLKIRFPNHEVELEMQRIESLRSWMLNCDDLIFHWGIVPVCTITIPDKSLNRIWSSTNIEKGSIELSDGLPSEFLFPLLLIYNRIRNEKRR